MSRNDLITAKRPVLIELIGPAGAGKTTQVEALCAQSDNFTAVPIPLLRNVRGINYLIRNSFSLIPIIMRLRQGNKSLNWFRTKMMIHLNGWDSRLGAPTETGVTVELLDHGPIYFLTTLLQFVPEIVDHQQPRNWFDSMVTKWSSLLSMVVWLDAPYAILAERINTRSDRHVVKGQSEDVITDFLAGYRSSFERVMSLVTAEASRPMILRFETNQERQGSITEQIIAALERLDRPHVSS